MTSYQKRLRAYRSSRALTVAGASRVVVMLFCAVVLLAAMAASAWGETRWRCLDPRDMLVLSGVSGLPYAPPPPGGCASFSVTEWDARYPLDRRKASYVPWLKRLEFREGWEPLIWHEATHYLQHVAGVPYDEEQAEQAQREMAIRY